MMTITNEGVKITSHATAQDILHITQAIHTATSVKLRNGYVISRDIINDMVRAIDEATTSYRSYIKQAKGAQK